MFYGVALGHKALSVFTMWKTLGFVEIDANGLKELSTVRAQQTNWFVVIM